MASVGVKAVLETVRGTVSGLNARSAGRVCTDRCDYRALKPRTAPGLEGSEAPSVGRSGAVRAKGPGRGFGSVSSPDVFG